MKINVYCGGKKKIKTKIKITYKFYHPETITSNCFTVFFFRNSLYRNIWGLSTHLCRLSRRTHLQPPHRFPSTDRICLTHTPILRFFTQSTHARSQRLGGRRRRRAPRGSDVTTCSVTTRGERKCASRSARRAAFRKWLSRHHAL